MRLHFVDVAPQLGTALGGQLLFPARLFQLLHQGVCLCTRARDDPLRFLTRALYLAFRVRLGAFQLVLRLLLFGVRLRRQAVGVLHLLFKALALLFELFHHVLKLPVFGGDKLLGTLHDLAVHAETLGDGKRVALARNAYQQPVGRLERRHVKLTAAVFDALGAQGKFL